MSSPTALPRNHLLSNLPPATLGTLPKEFLNDISDGKVNFPWEAQVNRLLRDGGFDLIISIGQVVPHEVAGMANFNKNI